MADKPKAAKASKLSRPAADQAPPGLRWRGFGRFDVGDLRFNVDEGGASGGLSLIHDLGRGSSHSVGAMGAYKSIETAELAALDHAAKLAAGGSCWG